jgi:prophage antirepressor-like protein
MSGIEQFQFGDREIRVIDVDGAPWWVALDVCRALEFSDPNRAISRLDGDDTRKTRITDSSGRSQDMSIINESGMYTLILRSNKPEARAFKRWVTSEVLPAIRRTGGYQATSVEVDSAIAKRLAEIAYKEHVVPGSARVLAFQRWNKPQKGMEAFGQACIQLELDISPLAPAIDSGHREIAGGTDIPDTRPA